MSDTAVLIQNLTKEYSVPRQRDKRVAVDDLCLEVPRGGLFGFLGPNGAGKTTTIKILLGFLPPTRGTAWLFGEPVWDDDARRRVGYLPEHPYFPKFLSAQEVVRAHAGLAGLSGAKARERADECLKTVDMFDNRHMPLSKCSKGMVQRVGLATAIVGDPDLLILDEPSSGLDPIGRKELRALLTTLIGEGKTIFVSSHLLAEMESVCDRVGILTRGKLVACGTPEEITQTREEVTIQIESAERDGVLAQKVQTLGGQVESIGESSRTNLLVPSSLLYRVLGLLETSRAKLIAIQPQRETLEDAFLRIVG
jgi:ABC-2 type transport system ATP-binding protein